MSSPQLWATPCAPWTSMRVRGSEGMSAPGIAHPPQACCVMAVWCYLCWSADPLIISVMAVTVGGPPRPWVLMACIVAWCLSVVGFNYVCVVLFMCYRARPSGWCSLLLHREGQTGLSACSPCRGCPKYRDGIFSVCHHVQCLWPERYADMAWPCCPFSVSFAGPSWRGPPESTPMMNSQFLTKVSPL